MRALRVLHVAPYFENAWAYGGIPRVISAQAHALTAAGHRITVATTDVRDARGRLEPASGYRRSRFASRVEHTADGIDVRVFPNLSNALAYRWQLYVPVGFVRYMRANARHFDVAHLHACHNLLTAAAARHLRRAGVPYVVQPNGTAPRIEQRRAAKLVFDILLARHVLPGAAFVLAVTQWEKRQLQERGSPGPEDPGLHEEYAFARGEVTQTEEPGLHEEDRANWGGHPGSKDPGLHGEGTFARGPRIRVVPNPLAPMPACPLPSGASFRERHNLTDGPLVVFLGMLSPRKQPDVLARAIAELRRSDVQLVFAGNDMGAERRTRALVRSLGLEAQTRFTGLVTGPSRFLALAAADIVVYPSRDEAFGLVPLEALQAGTPVIVCDDGGCGEIISDIGGGSLVPPGDVHALAAAIAAMLDDLPLWREKAVRAGTDASRRFNSDFVATQLEGVYRDAIARS